MTFRHLVHVLEVGGSTSFETPRGGWLIRSMDRADPPVRRTRQHDRPMVFHFVPRLPDIMDIEWRAVKYKAKWGG